MIALAKLAALFILLAIWLPVVVIALVACVIYEFLRGLWVTWCWLKEVGK